MSKTNLWIIIAATSVCIGTSLWWCFSRTSHRLMPPEASVSFQGFTSFPPGKPAALLSVSNPTPMTVVFDVFMLIRGVSDGLLPEHPPVVVGSLRSSESQTVSIPLPTTNDPWRVVLRFQERAHGLRGVADRIKDAFDRTSSRVLQPRYSGRIYYVTNNTDPQFWDGRVTPGTYSSEGQPRSNDSSLLRDARTRLRLLETHFSSGHPEVTNLAQRIRDLEKRQQARNAPGSWLD